MERSWILVHRVASPKWTWCAKNNFGVTSFLNGPLAELKIKGFRTSSSTFSELTAMKGPFIHSSWLVWNSKVVLHNRSYGSLFAIIICSAGNCEASHSISSCSVFRAAAVSRADSVIASISSNFWTFFCKSRSKGTVTNHKSCTTERTTSTCNKKS